MVAAALLLASISILITAIRWAQVDTRQDKAQARASKAICSIIDYAEAQAESIGEGDPKANPPRAPNPEGAANLSMLAHNMRATGIQCPPPTPSPSG